MGERKVPFLMDFLPLQGEEQTRIHPFFDHLKQGMFTTTRCMSCGEILWQPRVVCPHCNADEMEWVDLPKEGELFAFTAVLVGAPMGMEDDVPFNVGLVKLQGSELMVLSRIEGAPFEDLWIGQPVRFEVQHLPDGRAWFRFRVVEAKRSPR